MSTTEYKWINILQERIKNEDKDGIAETCIEIKSKNLDPDYTLLADKIMNLFANKH